MPHDKAYTFVAALLRRSKNRTPTNLDHYAKRSYRYCDLERGYIDERTKATRIEFGAPVFNPRPAFGRFVARRKLTSNDGGEFSATRQASGCLIG